MITADQSQLSEQGIVAPHQLAQVRSNGIYESAIKINDVYYYYDGKPLSVKFLLDSSGKEIDNPMEQAHPIFNGANSR
jgi:hypothetical protein